MIDELEQRINRAAEGMLENETLTSNLDDEAAQALLNWGLDCVKMIAQDTGGLSDVEAEDAMSPRLRATRRLMRRVNRWIPKRSRMDAEYSVDALAKVVDQATVIYGEDFVPPSRMQQGIFLRRTPNASPAELVAKLCALVEGAG